MVYINRIHLSVKKVRALKNKLLEHTVSLLTYTMTKTLLMVAVLWVAGMTIACKSGDHAEKTEDATLTADTNPFSFLVFYFFPSLS